MRASLAILSACLAAAFAPSAVADLPLPAGSPAEVVDLPSRPCQGPVDVGCTWSWGEFCEVYVEVAGTSACTFVLAWLADLLANTGDLLQCLQGPHPYMCLSLPVA